MKKLNDAELAVIVGGRSSWRRRISNFVQNAGRIAGNNPWISGQYGN